MSSTTRSDINIPAELLEEFYEYAVARKAINFKSGALVSRRWRDLCQQELFKSVSVSAVNTTGIHSIGTIADHAHLAKYIQEIKVVDLHGAPIPSSQNLLSSHFATFTAFLRAITDAKHMLIGHSRVDWSRLPADTLMAFHHVLGLPSFETLEVVGGRGFPASLLYGANVQTLSLDVVHGIFPPYPSVSHYPIHGQLRTLKLLDRASLRSLLDFLLNEEQLAGALTRSLHTLQLQVYDSTLQIPFGSSLVGQFIGFYGHSLRVLDLRMNRDYPIHWDDPLITDDNLKALVRLEKLNITLSVGMLLSHDPFAAADYIQCHAFNFVRGLPKPARLQNLAIKIRLSVSGSPVLQECTQIKDHMMQLLVLAFNSRISWPYIKEVKLSITFCGDRNTAAATRSATCFSFFLLDSSVETSPIRDFESNW